MGVCLDLAASRVVKVKLSVTDNWFLKPVKYQRSNCDWAEVAGTKRYCFATRAMEPGGILMTSLSLSELTLFNCDCSAQAEITRQHGLQCSWSRLATACQLRNVLMSVVYTWTKLNSYLTQLTRWLCCLPHLLFSLSLFSPNTPPPAAEITKTWKADGHDLTFPCVLMYTVLTVISHAAVCVLCMVHGPCVANRKMTPGQSQEWNSITNYDVSLFAT